MESLLKKIFGFKAVAVVGLRRLEDSEEVFVLKLQKKGTKLNAYEATVFTGAESAIENISSKLPVILCIDGKGILNKKIDRANPADIAWERGLDLTTLYYTRIDSGQSSFISFGRRSQFDLVVEGFKKKGIDIIDFYTGPFAGAFLNNGKEDRLQISGDWQLEFSGGILSGFSRIDKNNSEQVQIDGVELKSWHQLLFGAGISFFTGKPKISGIMPKEVAPAEALYRLAFNRMATAFVVVMFFTLFCSYLLTWKYSSENALLNQENVFRGQTYKSIVNLEKQKQLKMKMMEDAGHLSKHFLSFYVSEIVNSIPPELQVEELEVVPVEAEIKEAKKVMLNASLILLRGIASDEPSLNAWIKSTEKLEWFRKLQIINLRKDKYENQHFEIKLIL